MVEDGAMESMPLLRTRGALGTDRTLAGEDLVLLIPSKVVLTSLSKIEIRSPAKKLIKIKIATKTIDKFNKIKENLHKNEFFHGKITFKIFD